MCTCLIGPTLLQVFPCNDYHLPNMDPSLIITLDSRCHHSDRTAYKCLRVLTHPTAHSWFLNICTEDQDPYSLFLSRLDLSSLIRWLELAKTTSRPLIQLRQPIDISDTLSGTRLGHVEYMSRMKLGTNT